MTATHSLHELLRRGPAAIDGGLASELEARGHDLTGDLWSARLLRDDPSAIRDVHTTYFLAGATVGISASYQASRSGFVRAGLTCDSYFRFSLPSSEHQRQLSDLAYVLVSYLTGEEGVSNIHIEAMSDEDS